MQGAVSSDFVFLDGRDFPQQWKGSGCLLSVPKNHSFRVRTQLLHSSHSKPTLLFQALPCIVTPPHWLLSVLLGMSASFCPQDKLLFKKMYFC